MTPTIMARPTGQLYIRVTTEKVSLFPNAGGSPGSGATTFSLSTFLNFPLSSRGRLWFLADFFAIFGSGTGRLGEMD
jgi:hypothetical protein